MYLAQYLQKTLITLGLTKNPPTLIQSPFAKAVTARATTKIGKSEDTSTTRDSAATRSRKSHMIQVKNPVAVGRKLQSQYVMTENRTEMRTDGTQTSGPLRNQKYTRPEEGEHSQRYGKPVRKFAIKKAVGP